MQETKRQESTVKNVLITVGVTLATLIATLFVIGVIAAGVPTESVVVVPQTDAPTVRSHEPVAVPTPAPSPEWLDGFDDQGHFEYRYEGHEYFERGYDVDGYWYEYHSTV